MIDTIILAGGRGSRFGGLDKASLRLAGERLVDRVVAAARAVTQGQVIVVGPASAGSAADLVVREEPAFGGPLAAIATGLKLVRSDRVLILSCDLENPELVCRTLLACTAQELDGILLQDEGGYAQWLAGCYRTQSLNQELVSLGSKVENAAVRKVFANLSLHRIEVSAQLSADIDTPEALAQAQRRKS